jgi:DNA mismatch repair protein MutL
MLPAPPKIDLLPEHLIDQIKAGEVIERPGNLLKEILENSIDAGATRIELTLKKNGLDLISLKDNGHGMRFEDLPLAFSRHATSKISHFQDLYRLRSYGFRGEALASISAISRLQCITALPGHTDGAEIRIDGGQIVYHGTRKASSHGTELVIQDLFYNTPARLKFIQSQNSEKQFLRKVIFAFVLSNPGIEFFVQFDDEEKEIYAATPDVLGRINDIIPKARGLVVHGGRSYEENDLTIYIIPGNFKASPKWQYVFINDRMVLDKQFHRVISNTLQLAFGADDQHYLAFLKLPTDNIDVNVHPSKTVIKCMENSKIIALMTSTIKELAAPRKGAGPIIKAPVGTSQILDLGSQESMTLPQQRHEYNMEGLFSPHGLTNAKDMGLKWVGGGFFIREKLAYSAPRLLEKYVAARLEFASPTIPLLVSEPFPSKGVKATQRAKLEAAGLEIENMGPETLVLRGIPEWMNGFPLKEIISRLLLSESLSVVEIQHIDWSSSTWEEMISAFSVDELIVDKVAVDLVQLLREKLK